MKRPFLVRRTLARALLRLSGWRTAGQVPRRGILVGAPHTSNWDWVLTMLLAWDNSVQIRLLVKKEFFAGPLGPILRATGAVSIDRADPAVTIARLLEDAEVDETFLLGLAAEGTRSKTDYWKSGFYRISQRTGIPVTLAYLDRPSRTVGWGPTFALTGDVSADMDKIRAFYADKQGIRPELTTVPRLREEDR
ncbi:1-acyl-sn-glycerol-3-phosphate acyltransferase [Nocardioides currus]|uniref:Acyl-phosphate glycerol 3-phosphate acyltransferase n=1 Tax=Nocardioides currus TaxID=2133958 RepID=A0A2R7YSC5_9ACTN|nr:1-acyl-sn-glycerol-3-phosphate acyltransferase [Nocardioides currus]PUA79317.1 acyl-phosphate glycerol 3-phosphate acyltransferase [Nocardioides currus]